ncbi:DNA repair protein XRCC4-like [Corticium candelabrum]|uniref:DNA repair protein XRCC4-like n=1 Tax=Corticium candelabrum TaxID=121492 RepID=UPI002E27719E|nr:DNA repair protein XRCC4-like [Corticium candelabrum]
MERLCHLPAENGENYYLLTKQDERESYDMELFLTDGCDVWEKYVSKDDVKKWAKEVSMDIAPYVEETLKALTRSDNSDTNFQYEVKISGSRLQLIWKKVVSTDNIKYQLGCAVLQKQSVPKHHMTSMFEFAIAEIDRWKRSASSLESDVSRLSRERSAALQRYQEAVEEKSNLENELLTKFTMVLNSKKSKIRKLKEQIEQNGSTILPATTKGQGCVASGRQNLANSKENDKEDGDSTDYVESDDGDAYSKTPPRGQRSVAASSVPVSATDDLLGNIGDDDLQLHESPIKRARRGGRQTRAAAAMPSIPLVRQVTRTTSSSSSGSASGKNQKSESLEAGELMECM